MKRLNDLMPLVQKCADDPDVEAALKRMESPKQQPKQPAIN